MRFTWTDRAANESGYEIRHSADDGRTWNLIATLGPNAVTATVPVASLPGGGAARVFAITAVNAAGASPQIFAPDFAYADNDGDGLPNAYESLWGTDLNKRDTDGDGTPDAVDVLPLDADFAQLRVPEGNFSLFDLTELGLTPDYVGTHINDAGQMIVARSSTEADPDGRTELLDDSVRLPVPLASVTDFNNAGTVLGYPESDPNFVLVDAATWSPGNSVVHRRFGYEPAVSPPAAVVQPVGSRGYAINDNGSIVGHSFSFITGDPDRDLFWAATRWDGATASLVGDVYYYREDVENQCTPYNLNNAGTVVGEVKRASATQAPFTDAFVTENGAITRLPGSSDQRYAAATAINNHGVVAGWEHPTLDLFAASRTMLWPKVAGARVRKRLETRDAETRKAAPVWGDPVFISDDLEIFGYFFPLSGGVRHLWRNGALDDLAVAYPAGWQFAQANGMNQRGVMIGRGARPENGAAPADTFPAVRFPCDLWVDADLDGFPAAGDRQAKPYPRSLIVDVNNGKVGNTRRNADTTLDSAERNNFGYGPTTRVEPLRLTFGFPGRPEQYEVLLHLSPGPGVKLRVFDNSTPPKAVLGETATGEKLVYMLNAAQKGAAYPAMATFWIEGIEAGEADLELEIVKGSDTIGKDRIHLEVNADREPVAGGVAPKFPNRWRTRALKTVTGGIRGIRATLGSQEPMISWHKMRLRSGATASFWIGFDATPTAGSEKVSWAQTGHLARLAPNSSPERTGSNIYAEIAGDYGLFLQTLATRYYTKRGYPTEVPIPGDHKWREHPAISQRVEYRVNASNRFQDRIEIHLPKSSGGTTSVQMIAQEAEGSFPAMDLRAYNYDTYQVGAEMTASVTRLPGTPDNPAGISGIEIKTGLGDQVSPNWQGAAFTPSDLQIVTLDADGNSVTRQTGSYLHYNIHLENPGYVRLWDTYRWTNKDGKDW